MAYNLPLENIRRLTPEDFGDIPRCDPNVVRLREPSKMKDHQSYLFELCRDISPGREETVNKCCAFPRYIPLNALYRGNFGLILLVIDQWRKDRETVIKVPWPYFRHTAQETKETGTKEPGVIEKGASGLMKVTQSLFPYRRLVPPKKKKITRIKKSLTKEEEAKEAKLQADLKKSRYYERFYREFMFTEQAHRRSQAVDKNSQIGYVPRTYDFGYDPKCFLAMEYVSDAIPAIDWVRGHNLQENMELFLKILTFVRLCFHDADIAHCDLNPVSNILVRENIPIFLDFGISKGEHLEEITIRGEQFGTPEYMSPEQADDAKDRGPLDDIFACGRILHNILSGRRAPISVILAKKDEKGHVHYDHDLVQNLYPGSELPIEYQEVFKKTWNNGYAEIIEFQRDVEEILYLGKAPVISCQEPCEKVLELEKKVDSLISFQKFLGEK